MLFVLHLHEDDIPYEGVLVNDTNRARQDAVTLHEALRLADHSAIVKVLVGSGVYHRTEIATQFYSIFNQNVFDMIAEDEGLEELFRKTAQAVMLLPEELVALQALHSVFCEDDPMLLEVFSGISEDLLPRVCRAYLKISIGHLDLQSTMIYRTNGYYYRTLCWMKQLVGTAYQPEGTEGGEVFRRMVTTRRLPQLQRLLIQYESVQPHVPIEQLVHSHFTGVERKCVLIILRASRDYPKFMAERLSESIHVPIPARLVRLLVTFVAQPEEIALVLRAYQTTFQLSLFADLQRHVEGFSRQLLLGLLGPILFEHEQ